MLTQRVVVAGVGNIFLGDDGFGVEVARRLGELDLPGWVRVGDYGISGMHLAYDLADGAELAILVDAAPRGGEPGTVYLIEPDLRSASGVAATAKATASQPQASTTPQHQPQPQPQPEASTASQPQAGLALLDGHGMQPDVVLGLLGLLGGEVGRMLIVGCEPASVDYGIGLSAPVSAAVDEAVRLVLDLIDTTTNARPTATAREHGEVS